jgi:ribonuclease Z
MFCISPQDEQGLRIWRTIAMPATHALEVRHELARSAGTAAKDGLRMFALTFLGTSASVPSAARNHPGLLVESGGHRILIDCGEGTQRQLLQAGAGFRRLDRLLLTHGHFDHILGIPGLFSTLRTRRSADAMTIHGSPDTLDIVIRMLAGLWGEGRAPIPLQLTPLTAGRVIDAGEFSIDCFPIRHRDTQSVAFSFASPGRRHLRADRLTALGVPDGPVRKELAEGRKVSLAEGVTIDPEDVLGPPQGGRKLVIVGDTETTEGLAAHVRDADLLVIEATFLDRDAATARDYGHLTAREAATLAAEANVKQLVLNHISGRYPDAEIEAEARAIFSNTRIAADLDRITV